MQVEPLLVLVRTCGPDVFRDVVEVPDPNAANNAKSAGFGILPARFGEVPDHWTLIGSAVT